MNEELLDEIGDVEYIASYEYDDDLLVSNPGSARAINEWMHDIADTDPEKAFVFAIYKIHCVAKVKSCGTRKSA